MPEETVQPRFADFVSKIRYALAVISVLAVCSLVARHGFYLPEQAEFVLNRFDVLFLFFYVIQYGVCLVLSAAKKTFLIKYWFESLISFLILFVVIHVVCSIGTEGFFGFLLGKSAATMSHSYLVLYQILVLLTVVAGAIRLNSRLTAIQAHPGKILVGSFMVIIFFGTLLLMLPRSTVSPGNMPLLDALFTSTSAVCVTGLIVVDTGSYFTHFGQAVILALIQIGGLGIMTLASALTLFLRQNSASIREKIVLGEIMNISQLNLIGTALRRIVLLTFAVEAIGSMILMFLWAGEDWTKTELIYTAVFHSVSAFCNAGFSTFSDSLCRYSTNLPVVLVFAALITLGGLGFVVLMDIGGRKILEKNSRRSKLRLQTKLVLATSAILFVGGMFAFYVLDINRTGLERFSAALFNSVTARTAGFNTVSISMLSVPYSMILILLMFIGASPGSTGGGIKTTTLAVMCIRVSSIIRGKNRMSVFRKRLSNIAVSRAVVVLMFSFSVVFFSTLLLTITEAGDLRLGFMDLLFEEVSAFATVGLSCGITSELSSWGRIIIIASMFIGRLGPLTLAFAISAPGSEEKIEYPRENIMIG